MSVASLLCVFVVGAAGCTAASGDSVAATVGDTEITAGEVDATYERRAQAPPVASELASEDPESVDPNLQASVLTTLIRTEILRRAAEERDVAVADEQRSEQRTKLVEQVGGEEQLQQVLTNANISDEELQSNLTDQAIQSAISDQLAKEVTDQEVQSAFEQDAQGQYGEKVKARHILTETEEQANKAIDRIEGGATFEEVAKDVSTDPGSAQNGGDLGEVGKGMTVPEFEEAAFGAEVNQLVGPVQTDFGYHVIEVTEKVPAPELADVEDDIRQQLAQNKFTQYITDFASKLEIEVEPEYGTWDSQQIAVVPPTPSEAPSAPVMPPGGSELPLPDVSELPTAPAAGAASAAPTPQ